MIALSPHAHYKHSGVPWFAQIPSHWRPVAVKHLSTRITDGAHVSPDIEGGPYPFISTRDLTASGIDFEGALTTSEESFEQLERHGCRPKPGDILFSKDGTIGRTTVVTDDREFVVASSLIIITPDLQQVDPMFLDFLFQSTPVQEQVRSFVKGTGLPRISIRNLNRIIGLLPTLAEQHRITQFLTAEVARIDRLIGDQERLIALLGEKRQAIITHAVTKGLDPTAHTRPSGIPWLGDIPETWRTAELRRTLTFITSGSRGWAEFYADQGTPFVRIGNLTRGYLHLDMSETQHVEIPRDSEGTRAVVEANDVLFSITAYLGSVAVASEKESGSYVSQHVALTRLDQNRLQSRFLAYFVLSEFGQRQLNEGAYGGTKLQLSLEDIKRLRIPVPAISDQIEITRHLDASTTRIDALLELARESISLLRERRSALISAAVTGKIEVHK